MPEPFKTITIDPQQIIGDEALGTKTKFWIEFEGQDWLFKEARSNTGEDWSEKLAAEIAHLLGIPAAQVELATCGGRPGTLSKSFVNRHQGEELIHGNEVLAGQVRDYQTNQRWGQSNHTVENITKAIRGLFPDATDATVALNQLASYLILDGLIGNTDRHHENWAVLARWDNTTGQRKPSYTIAPSFDHASSLGRELQNDKIDQLLKEPGALIRYVNKGKGAIYLHPSDAKGQNPLYLAERGVKEYPEYFATAIQCLNHAGIDDILTLVECLPGQRINPNQVKFVQSFLHYTYTYLCKLKP